MGVAPFPLLYMLGTIYLLYFAVLPDNFNLTCSKSPSLKCGGPVLTSSVYCTCTATGVSPRTLQLQWSVSPYNVIQNETRDEGTYFNLISEVTIIPTSSEERVTCSLTGYQSEGIDSSLIMRTYDFGELVGWQFFCHAASGLFVLKLQHVCKIR